MKQLETTTVTPSRELRQFATLALVAAAAIAGLPGTAKALEVTAGDYEVYPAGINVGLLYFQHAQTGNLYVNGNKLTSDFKVKSDVGLARYIRPVKVNETVTVDLNVILPFGHLSTSGAAAPLGSASGTADLIIGAPVKFLLDPTSRDAFSIAPFIYLPTGSYDHNKPLNLGGNRWKGLLQLAYVTHFGGSWALDTVGDVEIHGKNTKFGPANATLKQAPRYEAQTHLRYITSPATNYSVGLGTFWGARDSVNGVSQDDRLKTVYGRLTATHFVDPTTQLQAQLGRDLSAHNGPEEKFRINLRFAKIF